MFMSLLQFLFFTQFFVTIVSVSYCKGCLNTMAYCEKKLIEINCETNKGSGQARFRVSPGVFKVVTRYKLLAPQLSKQSIKHLCITFIYYDYVGSEENRSDLYMFKGCVYKDIYRYQNPCEYYSNVVFSSNSTKMLNCTTCATKNCNSSNLLKLKKILIALVVFLYLF